MTPRPTPCPTPRVTGRDALRIADALADPYGGVVSRAELAAHGVTRDHVRRAVANLVWSVAGRRTIAVHRGPLSDGALRYRALWETHPSAALDGVSALQVAGLRHFETTGMHVSVQHRVTPAKADGVHVHKIARRVDHEVLQAGLARTRTEVACVRAAHWERTDRQAATVLLMTVQQRLTTPHQLSAAVRAIPGRNRRLFVRDVVGDIAGGVQALHELDFARMCRRAGLPEPTRQQVVQTPQGRCYLDAAWPERDLSVEIDGVQHSWGLNRALDDLKSNEVVLRGGRVLRMGNVALRVNEQAFLEQVRRGLAA